MLKSLFRTIPIKDFYGVGKVSAEKLKQAGILTGEDLFPLSKEELEKTTSDTTRNANNLAREAIAEIEKRKNVVLGENYEIIIQAQTNDSVDVQVRHIENSNTSTYGFFRYHASDKKLEEMDTTTGEYKSVE